MPSLLGGVQSPATSTMEKALRKQGLFQLFRTIMKNFPFSLAICPNKEYNIQKGR
jgi:hypothetical protein